MYFFTSTKVQILTEAEIVVRVEDFRVSEGWLQHQLGLPPPAPRLLHTLPSCNTWLRGSRRVDCCLPAPYSPNRRPPVVTHSDCFTYYVPSDGSVGGAGVARAVVLDREARGASWMPVSLAPCVRACVRACV